jgi:hypothetical protein
MGLGFLAPVFLAALAAVAIPIWLHLTHRERKEGVRFPSLMFLDRIPTRASRRRRIRHPLLLALRALALVLLVAAFARPLLERTLPQEVGVEPPQEVVILLDRSHSMAHGTRWTEAQAAVREIVEGLGPEDRASLVLFSNEVQVAVPSTIERSRILQVVDTLEPAPRGTRYAPALQAAAGILDDSPLGRGRALLVGDMQRSGWRGDEGIRFPHGAELEPVVVGAGPAPNRTVTGVEVDRTVAGGAERVTLTARVVNHGDDPVEELPVVLEVEGREVSSTRVSLPARGAASVALPPFTLAERWTRVTVRLAPDALPGDDAYHLVLSPGEGIPVLILDGSPGGEGALYLRRALEIADDPPFRVQVKAASGFQAGDLPGRRVIVFVDAMPPAQGELADRLAEWVARGGGLLVAPGAAGSGGGGGTLLPASVAVPEDRRDPRGGSLGTVSYDHPALELFARPRSGDLSAPRFLRYRPLGPRADAAVLARFDDGSPALVEGRPGRGRVLLWAATFDTRWGDLPVHPVFLPLVHRLTLHLADHRTEAMAFEAGTILELAGTEVLGDDGTGAPRTDRMALPPGGGDAVPLRPEDGVALLPLEEAGFYTLRTPGEGSGRGWTAAVNVDPTEADLTPMDAAELAASVLAREGETRRAGGGPAPPTREERERNQALWWYLLLGALLLLAAEAVLGNRLSRAASY